MNDLSPARYDVPRFDIVLTPERAKEILEQAGAVNVHIKARTSGKMWAYLAHEGKNLIFGLRLGAYERNFIRDVSRELSN
jgi:hypothetical protein